MVRCIDVVLQIPKYDESDKCIECDVTFLTTFKTTMFNC